MDEARRLHYLAAMGIEVWQPLSDQDAEPAPQPALTAQPTTGATGAQAALQAIARASLARKTQAAVPAATSHSAPAAAATAATAAAAATDEQRQITGMDWDTLAACVAECRRCPLCETRTKTVFGTGDRHAELLFVGEGPGQDEDQQGEPFVGRAGQLLNKMLAAIGLAREQVYIANIVKCRPPRNRNPAPEEASACRPYLERQIALLQPKLIVSLGAVSANNLLGNSEAVGRMRGKHHHYQPGDGAEPIPLLVTYHPSYYLRSPAEKAKGWQDLQRIITLLRERR
jgi:DNA polymerase